MVDLFLLSDKHNSDIEQSAGRMSNKYFVFRIGKVTHFPISNISNSYAFFSLSFFLFTFGLLILFVFCETKSKVHETEQFTIY